MSFQWRHELVIVRLALIRGLVGDRDRQGSTRRVGDVDALVVREILRVLVGVVRSEARFCPFSSGMGLPSGPLTKMVWPASSFWGSPLSSRPFVRLRRDQLTVLVLGEDPIALVVGFRGAFVVHLHRVKPGRNEVALVVLLVGVIALVVLLGVAVLVRLRLVENGVAVLVRLERVRVAERVFREGRQVPLDGRPGGVKRPGGQFAGLAVGGPVANGDDREDQQSADLDDVDCQVDAGRCVGAAVGDVADAKCEHDADEDHQQRAGHPGVERNGMRSPAI